MKAVGCIFFSCVSVSTLSIAPNTSYAQTIDAFPITRNPPIMPEMANHSGHCNISFDITKDGRAKNIKASFCTDNIFEESATSSVKKWIYSPKTINGIATLREDVRTKVTFVLADMNGDLIPESEAVDPNITIFDHDMKKADIAYPWPPYYGKPRKGEDSGFCCIEFSVSQIGSPFNVNMQSCSHEKFDQSANMAIRQWKYKPITLNKKPVSSIGYMRVIHFAKRSHAMIKDPNGYTPTPGKIDDYERFCRAVS